MFRLSPMTFLFSWAFFNADGAASSLCACFRVVCAVCVCFIRSFPCEDANVFYVLVSEVCIVVCFLYKQQGSFLLIFMQYPVLDVLRHLTSTILEIIPQRLLIPCPIFIFSKYAWDTMTFSASVTYPSFLDPPFPEHARR